MLQHVSVKGFRSLADFDLEIREGLNVLVGPNGAGKTNIILFFEFLRSISTTDVRDAVAEAGGVSQIFRKKGKQSFHDRLEATLKGGFTKGDDVFEYVLSIAVKFDMASQDVYFLSQYSRISVAGSEVPVSEITWKIGDIAEPSSDVLLFPVKRARGKSKAFGHMRDYIESDLFRASGFARQRLLLPFLAEPDDVNDVVAGEISGRFVLNVVPSHVKRPEDSTRPPGIETDGSGVSATLYAIKRGKNFLIGRHFRDRALRRKGLDVTYEGVIGLIKVAVPSIKSIEVINDPFDSKLKCQIAVGGGAGSVVPLSSLSDGTVKWISLVLRLATSQSSLLLEEPENYLHPLMQREIVRLLRDRSLDNGFSMVSTHSETLLNAVKAEELVIVSYGSSGTKARRVSNAEQVACEINRTGFGLGYYYLAEAVES